MTTIAPPSSPPKLLRQKRGRTMWIPLAAIVILFVAAVAWGLSRMGQPDPAQITSPASGNSTGSLWFNVAKRSFDLSVIAAGELESKQKIEIKSEVEGNVTIVDVVAEGTQVKAGDVVVRLASDDIREKLSQETIAAENARSDKAASEATLAIQINQNATSIDAAKLKLSLAELNLAKWANGDDPQKRRELSLGLEKAKRTLVQAKRNKELSEQLYEEKFISQSELEDDEIKALEADNDLATADLAIKVYEAYSRPEDEKKARSDVDQAKADLEKTGRENDRNTEKLKADLTTKASNLQIREERMAKFQDQFNKTIIKAPGDGLVVYSTSIGPGWRRQQPITQGRQIHLGELIMILPDTRDMVAALKVNEALIAQVKLAQKVMVSIDARGDKPVEGAVKQLAVTADDGGWMNPDLREYVVRVELPPGIDLSLKPGMRCSGQIFIGRVENAIAVPIQSVFVEGDQRFCYVPDTDNRVKRQSVTLGPASESYVQITKGLNEGDRVLLRKPKPGETVEKG